MKASTKIALGGYLGGGISALAVSRLYASAVSPDLSSGPSVGLIAATLAAGVLGATVAGGYFAAGGELFGLAGCGSRRAPRRLRGRR